MQSLTLFWRWSFAIPILHLMPKDMIKPAQNMVNLLVLGRYRTFYKFSFQYIPKYSNSNNIHFNVMVLTLRKYNEFHGLSYSMALMGKR